MRRLLARSKEDGIAPSKKRGASGQKITGRDDCEDYEQETMAIMFYRLHRTRCTEIATLQTFCSQNTHTHKTMEHGTTTTRPRVQRVECSRCTYSSSQFLPCTYTRSLMLVCHCNVLSTSWGATTTCTYL